VNTKPTLYQPRHHDPQTIAFVMCGNGEEVTFGELEERANQGAHLFRNAGIQIGDHIAILMENRREFLEICFAADRAGIYYSTVSTHLTENEIDYVLKDCGARMVIGSMRYIDTLMTLQKKLDQACEFYLTDDSLNGLAQVFSSWANAIKDLPTTPIGDEAQGLDMLYSSGTTGRPKGIKWPLTGEPPGTQTMLVELLTSLYGYSAQTRYLSPAPLYHAAPLRHSMVTIKMGGTAYIMERFDAYESLRLIETHKITHSQWVPTMFVRLLKLPPSEVQQFDLSSMQVAVHAAAPCPVNIKYKMIDWWGNIIQEYYAGTENNGFTSITCEEWLANYFENGHQFSYHNDSNKTKECCNKYGWTTLGDIGRLDKEGYLYLTDRKSFVIISGGVNIYPQETENTLIGHPSVLDVAVIGIPDENFGEAMLAIVQLLPSINKSEQLKTDLNNFCHDSLSSIKCPKSIEFRDSLPRSATGKLYKRKLRDEYWL